MRLSLLLLVLTITGQNLAYSQENTFIDSILNANFPEDGPGGVLLVAKDGKAIYKKAFGMASIELNVKNSPEMSFRIGSVSKQFASVAILQLVEANKIELNDDIRKYLPDYNSHGRTITVSQILTHTSGIPSYTENPEFSKDMFNDKSKKELIDSFMNDSLLFEPGTDWSYSNSGYVLAGRIVESVSGMDFNEYLQERIFDPLKMTSTYIGTYDKILPNTAYGYESAGNGEYKPATYLSWSWPYAAGAIISSVDDMLKWDNALYTNKLIGKNSKSKAWAPAILKDGRLTNYGYGWGVSTYENKRFIAHGGGINGFLTMGIRIPEERLYVILLTNSTTVSPTAIAEKVAIHAAGLKQAKPKFKEIENMNLADYVGAYEIHTMGGRIVSNFSDEPMYRYITIENDTLWSQPSGESKTAILPVDSDLFYFMDSDVSYLKFFRDEYESVKALEISVDPITFGPKEYEPRVEIEMLSEKKEVTVSNDILLKYVGKYDFGGGFYMEVIAEGEELFILPTAQPKQRVYAESETKFFMKEIDASMEFIIEEDGTVKKMKFKQGPVYEATRIE